MAEFKATAAQKAAIESRGSAVLVSAGAGSGKTKVLTERLMGFITDPEHPADLDSFLIITFTKAAAKMTSRHNLKYWKLDDYLGIGPAAHSFIDGKRFFYDRSLTSFMNGTAPVSDGIGGTKEEQIMLALRLNEGLAVEFNPKLLNKCKLFEQNGLLKTNDNRIILTDKGMLLSNSIITEIMECI